MKPQDTEVKVKTHWRPSADEPSSTVRRLWRRLLQKRPRRAKTARAREEKPTSTGEAAANGESKDAEKQDL